NVEELLKGHDGILVPGGFGERAVHGKMFAIKYARVNKIPFLGICLGMQLSLIEYARNVLGYTKATSREYDDFTQMPIIELKPFGKEVMRLGLYDCELKEGTKIRELYGVPLIKERHRHRYEF